MNPCTNIFYQIIFSTKQREHVLQKEFGRCFKSFVYLLIDFNKMINYRNFIVIISCFFSACFLYSCKDYYRNKSNGAIPISSIRKGERMAAKYCQSCHLLPGPHLLDAKTWEEGVLPVMGPHLGIFEFNFKRYPSAKNDKFLSKNFYPSQPQLNPQEWSDLINYYIATSPDSLAPQARQKQLAPGLSLFQVQVPQFNYPTPAVSFIKIDSSTLPHQLVVCDASQNIFRFNNQLQIIDTVHTSGPIVDMDFTQRPLVACNIAYMNPTNGKFGKAELLRINANGGMQEGSTPLFSELARPIQVSSSDLNLDGRTDYLICGFGNLTGAFSWMENKGGGKYENHVLRAVPGAIKAIVQDQNKDGLPDIWVLFGQGDEGIILFTNKGNGRFEQQRILRFPPVYGSTYFELIDFNKDGYQDIVYTCGDNSDYSQVLKPYHGVYIFLNDAKGNFSKKYFFPVNGCYKAIPRDFDGDGDLDIAAISFFADYAKQPEEGFVYLENEGDFEFQPFIIPETKMGRWLTMDAGDLDGDGKVDIVLGNFSVAPVMIKPKVDWGKGPVFMFLKNMGKTRN